jgi:hypothetical protein
MNEIIEKTLVMQGFSSLNTFCQIEGKVIVTKIIVFLNFPCRFLIVKI